MVTKLGKQTCKTTVLFLTAVIPPVHKVHKDVASKRSSENRRETQEEEEEEVCACRCSLHSV